MNIKNYFLPILMMIVLLSACSTSAKPLSFLERSSCNLPCWNRIIAGQTTEDEVLKILGSLPDINHESVQFTNEPWNIFDNQFYFVFRQSWGLNQNPKLRGQGTIKNNVVSDLIICGELNTTMGELVEQIGEPESIISGNNFYGGRTVILINSKKMYRFGLRPN